MAAGLGFKTFNTGDVLSAADVNGYLMQGVMVFASAAARDAAITAPAEGQFAFTKDTNGLWYYDGAAWVASGATGDIEGVTAGTGISGGGTSGTVTITNSMATAIDAKGDLVVGTGADTFSRLAAGTNGYLLTADSAQATGLKWAAAAGGGKVLQVVGTTYSTNTVIASTTMSDTGLSLSITPTSATSKILVLVSQNVFSSRAIYAVSSGYRLMRDSTSVLAITDDAQYLEVDSAGNTAKIGTMNNIAYLDSPATTSATTYKTQGRAGTTAQSGQVIFQRGDLPSSMVLLEIGA
jgi:hypothetical protein